MFIGKSESVVGRISKKSKKSALSNQNIISVFVFARIFWIKYAFKYTLDITTQREQRIHPSQVSNIALCKHSP